MTSTIYDSLRRLIEWTGASDALTLSLYLDISPGHREQALEFASSTCEELIELHEEDRDAEVFSSLVNRWLDKLPNIVGEARSRDYDGVVLFLCAEPLLEEHLVLRFSFENHAVVGSHLSLANLLTCAEEYERAVCVLLEGDRVQLSEMHIGDVVSTTEVASSAHRDLVGELNVALRGLIEDNPTLHVIIFTDGNPAATSVEGALIEEATSRIIDRVPHAVDPGSADFLKEAHRSLQRYERRSEAEGVDRLLRLKRSANPAGAAVGLSEVLEAANKGCVEVLYILQSLQAQGWMCDVCDRLGDLPSPPACIGCGASVSDIALEEALIDRAASCGAEIETVYANETLLDVGGVGALIRK